MVYIAAMIISLVLAALFLVSHQIGLASTTIITAGICFIMIVIMKPGRK